MTSPLTLLWLRRDLRLHDHAALAAALTQPGVVQPVFIFDTDILAHFPHSHDRRLPFIADALCNLHETLQARGGGLLILHGNPVDLIPVLARALGAQCVIAAEDYELAARLRDEQVKERLRPIPMHRVKDQLIFSPDTITKEDGSPYKVFTPYSTNWRAALTPLSSTAYEYDDRNRYADASALAQYAKDADIGVLTPSMRAADLLTRIGYHYKPDTLWPADAAEQRVQHFISHHAAQYGTERDFMARDATSRLSPYLRFGLISIRHCLTAALRAHADIWLKELIWREFYAMILYHFPESASQEWNPKYRGVLEWSRNREHFSAWQQGQTGYPIVDAAMRQLLTEGWMHNRARMIVASFLTKHLRIDWRWGEAHFAQYLMDYEMSSNVGGWQWAASTGTDAQPYFRIFNPVLQSEKFDPKGEYIRRYVPELAALDARVIHAPWKAKQRLSYPPPLVDHKEAREAALAMFNAL